MKNQLIIIGVIAILITVGLSGCNNNDAGITSFKELMDNPPQYYNKNITMKGYIENTVPNASGGPYNAFFYDSATNTQYVLVLIVPSNIDIHIGNYKITGTVLKQIYATPKIQVISAVAI